MSTRLTILAAIMFPLAACRSTPSTSTAPADARPQQAESAVNDTTEAPPSTKPTNPDDHRPILVCFGDSLTAGYGTDPGQAYPDFLQTDLDRLGLHYRVVNLGVSGNTTKDGVARLPDVLALHPAAVVVEFGGNDGLRGLRIEDSRASLDQIVSALKAANIRIALAGITLPPDYGPDYIKQFNTTYTLLAQKYHVPLLPFLLKNVYGVPGLMQPDNTHATAKGNQVVAENVVTLIRPLLKK